MNNDTPIPNRDSASRDQNRSAEQPLEIITPVREENTTQGSEFLDDAIRVKEQPFKDNKTKMQKKDPRSLL